MQNDTAACAERDPPLRRGGEHVHVPSADHDDAISSESEYEDSELNDDGATDSSGEVSSLDEEGLGSSLRNGSRSGGTSWEVDGTLVTTCGG